MHGIDSAECVALSGIAKQTKKILFSTCASDDFTGKDGNEYVFRIPNITARTQGYAAAEYVNNNLKSRGNRIFTIAHDRALGRLAVADFKEHMKQVNPRVEFVGEAWPKINEASYASFIGAMTDANPDIVYFVWAIGFPYWQQSAGMGLPQKFAMVSSYSGGSDEMQVLPKQEVPVGAVLGGFPWYAIDDPANTAFVEDLPQGLWQAAVHGGLFDVPVDAGAQGRRREGREHRGPGRDQGAGRHDLPIGGGPVTIRAFDHQGTTPFWLGKAAWDDQRKMGVLTDITKLPTDRFLPSEQDVKKEEAHNELLHRHRYRRHFHRRRRPRRFGPHRRHRPGDDRRGDPDPGVLEAAAANHRTRIVDDGDAYGTPISAALTEAPSIRILASDGESRAISMGLDPLRQNTR